MGDYIKREDVLSAFKNAIPDVFEYDTYDELLLDEGISRERCQKIISNIPTADVQKVKHGTWIFDGECGITKCSNCKWSIEEYFTNPNTRKPYVFCPNCGAKMDLEGEE